MNYKNKRYSIKERGITLIALVVTIIVLLILAGITIQMVLGQNGLIQRTRDTKETQDKAKAREELQVAMYPLYVDYETGNEEGTFRDFVFSTEAGKGQQKLKAELGAENLVFNNPQIKY